MGSIRIESRIRVEGGGDYALGLELSDEMTNERRMVALKAYRKALERSFFALSNLPAHQLGLVIPPDMSEEDFRTALVREMQEKQSRYVGKST